MDAQLLIWRPILAGRCSLDEVKRGVYALVDLQKMNALLDMKTDIHNQAMDDANQEGRR